MSIGVLAYHHIMTLPLIKFLDSDHAECLSVCQPDYCRSYERILVKFYVHSCRAQEPTIHILLAIPTGLGIQISEDTSTSWQGWNRQVWKT